MGVETLMAKEAVGLLKRRPDKLKHIVGQYSISFLDCEVSRTGRAAYFFIRYMDDILDGDRKLPTEDNPLMHIASMRSQVETGKFTDKPEIMKLAEHSLNALTKKARPNDNPRQDFLDVIDIMVFDYQRRQERRALTENQLDDYYRKTFYPVNNLMLIGLRSGLRAVDIPDFSLCQGKVYTIEHLISDWQSGIINIPSAILGSAGLTQNSACEDVIQSLVIKDWGSKELRECKTELLSLQAKIPLSEELTCRIYKTLTNSMLKFIDKYFQKNFSFKIPKA